MSVSRDKHGTFRTVVGCLLTLFSVMWQTSQFEALTHTGHECVATPLVALSARPESEASD